jgi:hypothetical protein
MVHRSPERKPARPADWARVTVMVALVVVAAYVVIAGLTSGRLEGAPGREKPGSRAWGPGFSVVTRPLRAVRRER